MSWLQNHNNQDNKSLHLERIQGGREDWKKSQRALFDKSEDVTEKSLLNQTLYNMQEPGIPQIAKEVNSRLNRGQKV